MNTAKAVSGKADAPTIEIAAHAGTCYGVQRALDMALAAAPAGGGDRSGPHPGSAHP